MKKSIYKVSLFLGLFVILSVSLFAQEGYYGKKLSVQASSIYHRYTEQFLSIGNPIYNDNYQFYPVINYFAAAKVRVLSPELSLNYTFDKRRSVRFGFKSKQTPVLQTVSYPDFEPLLILNDDASLASTGSLPVRTVFFEYRKFNKFCQAPVGAYKAIGIEYSKVGNPSSLGKVLFNGDKYPIKLEDPIKMSFLGISLSAGRNIPLGEDIILNIDSRLILPLLGQYRSTFANGIFQLNYNESNEYFELNNSLINPTDILIARIKEQSSVKFNFSIGIQYMIK